ncbi:MAG: 30S ribosomal protein S8e [Candidatus Woesearchaeota archaeon]|jgi:small subunit ribosomal protein S8e
MTVSQKQSHRNPSGGVTTEHRKRRQFDDGRESFKPTIASNTTLKKMRVLGGNTKIKALYFDKANVFSPKTGKHKVVAIKTVVENKANINFVRRNILTKGTIVETEAGKAKITSRPGQEGVVNAVLID